MLVLAAAPLAALSVASTAADETWSAIGVTRQGAPIRVRLPAGAFNLAAPQARVVVVAGLDQNAASTAAAESLGRWYDAPEQTALREKVSLALIPRLFPEGPAAAAPGNTPGTAPAAPPPRFPPDGKYYDDPLSPEVRYLWRWLAMYGGDLVIDLRSGKQLTAQYSGEAAQAVALVVCPQPQARSVAEAAGDLVRELARETAGEAGAVAALRLQVDQPTDELWKALFQAAASLPRSANRAELLRRQSRTPAEVAAELALHYGGSLKQVAYIPALGVLGRQQVALRAGDEKLKASVAAALAPYLAGQTPQPKSGSEQAGHLLFAELARQQTGAKRERLIALCRAAADQIFGAQGQPLAPMPFHNEMSDAFFMATPIVCATGALTGEARYFDAALGHFRAMEKLCLRPDGIYRHSPLDEAAWGRGNGFAALGTAWSLSELPADHPARSELLTAHLRHLRALLKHQDASGSWRQVIDRPESYREFTCTCMISWALVRGVERGWLPAEEFSPAAQRAWRAIAQRVGPQGRLVDVCTGTGKMKSLRDYYDRSAILGADERGGAMSLLIANEWARAQKIQPLERNQP